MLPNSSRLGEGDILIEPTQPPWLRASLYICLLGCLHRVKSGCWNEPSCDPLLINSHMMWWNILSTKRYNASHCQPLWKYLLSHTISKRPGWSRAILVRWVTEWLEWMNSTCQWIHMQTELQWQLDRLDQCPSEADTRQMLHTFTHRSNDINYHIIVSQ